MAVTVLNLDRLLRLSYQTARDCIKKMEFEQAQEIFDELEVHIDHMYTMTTGYAAPKIEKGASAHRSAPIGPRDFGALISGVKKLEIIYGYFWDRLHDTDYSSVR